MSPYWPWATIKAWKKREAEEAFSVVKKALPQKNCGPAPSCGCHEHHQGSISDVSTALTRLPSISLTVLVLTDACRAEGWNILSYWCAFSMLSSGTSSLIKLTKVVQNKASQNHKGQILQADVHRATQSCETGLEPSESTLNDHPCTTQLTTKVLLLNS